MRTDVKPSGSHGGSSQKKGSRGGKHPNGFYWFRGSKARLEQSHIARVLPVSKAFGGLVDGVSWGDLEAAAA